MIQFIILTRQLKLTAKDNSTAEFVLIIPI
jgi:hypothetical protein